jgi:ATP-dependent Lon protease
VPEGAVPKDGPSAGAAMVTAIISTLSGIEVRRDLAMTGEVNLRGYVTAIGGVKEKFLGAIRGGIKTVLIPKDNEKDLADIPDNIKKALEIIPVNTIEEVLSHALIRLPEPISEKKDGKIDEIGGKSAENKEKDVIHH